MLPAEPKHQDTRTAERYERPRTEDEMVRDREIRAIPTCFGARSAILSFLSVPVGGANTYNADLTDPRVALGVTERQRVPVVGDRQPRSWPGRQRSASQIDPDIRPRGHRPSQARALR